MGTADMGTAEQKPCIVVGVDGSQESRQALRWATRLVSAIGAKLDSLAVWHLPALVFGPLPTELTHPPELRMETTLNETVEAVFGADRPDSLRLLVREGDPAEVLVGRSNTATIVGRR